MISTFERRPQSGRLARLQRTVYQAISAASVELAEKHSITQLGKSDNPPTTFHYSFDLPSRCNTQHNPLQHGPIFFKTLRKMQFFAVNAEGILRQMNYLNDEAVYFRLLPRNSATQEGKRHVKTVPVKLTRAHSDKHSTHPDTHSLREHRFQIWMG